MQQKETENNINPTLKDFNQLIETIAKVEYSRLSNHHLIDFSDLVNIGTMAVHTVLSSHKEKEFNTSYMSTAIKWAIRNELRRRFKWYSSKAKKTEIHVETGKDINELKKEELREVVYETILSIDDHQDDNETPLQIKDDSYTPEENYEYNELSVAIKEVIKKLPQREKEVLESRFFKGKKLREIADDLKISASRTSRIIQNGLDKVKIELQKKELI